ncbi:MAG TPA: DNA polymerase ligase N-terminal domain-containing protein, partial [Myxococcales bacterium]|nr:DNA polymerase ligase N-terminal domain-containing protein [Myxococcales bacterium]
MPNFPDERPARRFMVVRQAGARGGYALHLETDGVLRSWAVPRGPSPDPAERRFAVEIEASGAADGEPWDFGGCTPVQDFATGIHDGKLLFELRGYKLRGAWTLVRTRGREWLLIKETSDAHVRRAGTFPDAPVLPTAAGAAAVRAAIRALDPPKQRVRAADVQPMLAEVQPRPFTDSAWLFEL